MCEEETFQYINTSATETPMLVKSLNGGDIYVEECPEDNFRQHKIPTPAPPINSSNTEENEYQEDQSLSLGKRIDDLIDRAHHNNIKLSHAEQEERLLKCF